MKGLTIAIIHSYEATDQLQRCVHSLRDEASKVIPLAGWIDWILIKTPKAKGKDTSFFPGRVLESMSDNLGSNRDLALKSAKTGSLYFIDPDCWVCPGSLLELYQAFLREKDNPSLFGFAGPNVLKSENVKLNRMFGWLGELRVMNGGLSQVAVSDKDRVDWHSPTCNILYNLRRLENAFFCSRFPSAGEDLEFNFRQSKGSKKILILAKAKVWHEQPAQLYPYLKKIFNYGKAQTFLLKAQPASIFNRRLMVLFASLCWVGALVSLPMYLQKSLVLSTVLGFVLLLCYEIHHYQNKEGKDYLSFSSSFFLIAGFYLMGQVSGLLIPLPKRRNAASKSASSEDF